MAGRRFSGNGGTVAFTQGQASCGDCHDIWIDPKNPVRYALDGRRRRLDQHAQRRRQRCASRTGRCTTSTSTTACRTGSTATGRTTARCADRRRAPRRPAAGACPRTARCRSGAAGLAGEDAGAAVVVAADAVVARRPRWQDREVRAARAVDARRRPPPWQPNIGGCESGFTIPDPTNADIVYATCYGNKVTRWDARTGTAHSIEPWMMSLDSPPNEAKYRCHWTSPMAIDPFDTNNVLYGCQMILKTSNERPVVDRAQPGSFDEGSVAHRVERRPGRRQPRPVRRRSRVVDRVLEDSARPDLGRHQRRQALVHEDDERRARGTTSPRTSRTCRSGARSTQIWPSHLRPGDGLRRGRRST